MINMERLGVLLDRGADVAAAVQIARTSLSDAEGAVRQAQEDLATAEFAAKAYRGPEDVRNRLVESAAAKRAGFEALEASVGRRRSAHASIAKRGQAWLRYCASLRSLAKTHGVEI